MNCFIHMIKDMVQIVVRNKKKKELHPFKGRGRQQHQGLQQPKLQPTGF